MNKVLLVEVKLPKSLRSLFCFAFWACLQMAAF